MSWCGCEQQGQNYSDDPRKPCPTCGKAVMTDTPTPSEAAWRLAEHYRAQKMTLYEFALAADVIIAQAVQQERERGPANTTVLVAGPVGQDSLHTEPQRAEPSALKQQLDAIVEKSKSWPDWVKREIEVEVAKTPDRRAAVAQERERAQNRRECNELIDRAFIASCTLVHDGELIETPQRAEPDAEAMDLNEARRELDRALNDLRADAPGSAVDDITRLIKATIRAETTAARAQGAEQMREAGARTAENPGFIQAQDTEWDEGVNYAKRFVAKAIRALPMPGER